MAKRLPTLTDNFNANAKRQCTSEARNSDVASSALNPFQYGPAIRSDQIRLLKLKGGEPGTNVELDLHVQERGKSEYHALSYVWGSPICDQPALCNGQRLMITQSLQLALLRLLHDYAGQYLWVDAVCINQADPQDKSAQVRRMSTIYREAAAVIVWLEEEDGETGAGIELLTNLCKAFPSCNGDDIRSLYLDHSLLPDPYELDKSGQLERLGIPSDTASAPWQAAAKILDAAWFGRRWVLQEVTSSRKCRFRIGSHETTPEIILGGAYRIATFPEFKHALNQHQRKHCDRVESIVQLLRAQQSSWLHESLADICLETSSFESSDPRDRIFAIVGCLDGFPEHLIDYTKTLPEVLINVAMCEDDQEEFLLSLLRGLCYVDELIDDVPSWIPTWQFCTPLYQPLWNETEEDGTDVSQMEMTISEDKRVLQTRAIIFDRTASVSDPTYANDGLPFATDDAETQKNKFIKDLEGKCDWLAQCESIAKDAAPDIDTEDECLERFLRCYVLGADYVEDLDFITTYQTYLRHSAIMSATQTGGGNSAQVAAYYRERCQELHVHPNQPLLGDDDDTIALKYKNELVEIADSWFVTEPRQRYGRRFFASKRGKIGWVPQAVRTGDELCVVSGFATPFAIRKVKDSCTGQPAQYRLLGACYVHEHMDGEIFLDDELERVTIQIV